MAQWNQNEGGAGSNGHVAIVTAVNSNGTVNIEEYNYATKGGYGTRSGITAPAGPRAPVGFCPLRQRLTANTVVL